jgi:SAM-dependent methyltransferase
VVAGDAVSDVRLEDIAGLTYVRFEGAPPPAAVAALSSAYALFEVEAEHRLRPVPLPRVDRYDDDLVSTQRYVGKTNETFTKLLVNVTLAAVGAGPPPYGGGASRVTVLDPLCGRGTTLHQAMTYGADAFGIDTDAKATEAYAAFLRTWLEDKRLKHQLDPAAGRHRFRVTIGRKGAAAAEERQRVDVVTGDTVDAPVFFGRNRVDAIVTDLPYGVQHGARQGDDRSRRPDDLLVAALPAWWSVLRPGGAAGISWNSRMLRRDALLALLEGAGFEVADVGADGSFVHRVDRTITRDLVVARRPPAG